jgi:C4-dicarboxylate-specific signal transduction histidine kinase
MAFSFNEMQLEIQKTANSFNEIRQRLYSTLHELKTLNETLEKRVAERTKELHTINQQLQNEIFERTKMEQKVKKIHNQLVTAARKAGMADIAKSTMHNIGNILNSINTSAALLQQKINISEMEGILQLAEMLKQHAHDIDNFLLNDEKGQLVPNYISALAEQWVKDKEKFNHELNALSNNIEHIRNIINMQQTLSTAIGIPEEIVIKDIINEALALQKEDAKANIKIIKKLSQTKKITVDRVKLLQIIVNLINNAIDALVVSRVKEKVLTLSLQEKEENFQIIIQDNGIGIAEENIQKLFSYGFTTKESGHGLGLHSSSLEIKEMGGILEAKSEGVELGATFTLTLPYFYNKEKVVEDIINH